MSNIVTRQTTVVDLVGPISAEAVMFVDKTCKRLHTLRNDVAHFEEVVGGSLPKLIGRKGRQDRALRLTISWTDQVELGRVSLSIYLLIFYIFLVPVDILET